MTKQMQSDRLHCEPPCTLTTLQAILAEQHRLAEEERSIAAHLAQLNKAATKIQANWRGHALRKHFKEQKARRVHINYHITM